MRTIPLLFSLKVTYSTVFCTILGQHDAITGPMASGSRDTESTSSLPVWQHYISPKPLLGLGARLNCWNLEEEALWGRARGQGVFSSQEDLLFGAFALFNQEALIPTSSDLGDFVLNAWGCSPGFAELNRDAFYAWLCEGGPGASCQHHGTSSEAKLSAWTHMKPLPAPPRATGEGQCVGITWWDALGPAAGQWGQGGCSYCYNCEDTETWDNPGKICPPWGQGPLSLYLWQPHLLSAPGWLSGQVSHSWVFLWVHSYLSHIMLLFFLLKDAYHTPSIFFSGHL